MPTRPDRSGATATKFSRNCGLANDERSGTFPLVGHASKTKGWGPKRRIVAPGKVSWEMLADWLGPRGVILRGGGLDEAPQAYRRLPEVLRAQGHTIEVVHTLRPIIVAMAGENEFDPYKD